MVSHTQGTLDPFVFNVVGLRGVRGLCCNKRARSPKNTILQDNKVFPGQLWGDPGSLVLLDIQLCLKIQEEHFENKENGESLEENEEEEFSKIQQHICFNILFKSLY